MCDQRVVYIYSEEYLQLCDQLPKVPNRVNTYNKNVSFCILVPSHRTCLHYPYKVSVLCMQKPRDRECVVTGKMTVGVLFHWCVAPYLAQASKWGPSHDHRAEILHYSLSTSSFYDCMQSTETLYRYVRQVLRLLGAYIYTGILYSKG